ncbi:MAG: hypothetical protein H8E37_03165 [Planctomycetes bacterium]|nr:hypothetical protein [Planctomycetota bacterium]
MARKIRIDQPQESRPHIPPEAFVAPENESAVAEVNETDAPVTAAEDAGPILVTDAAASDGIRPVERQVQQELLTHPDVTFSSITVSQVEDGVCLQGRLEYVGSEPDVCGIVRKIAQVETVWNELVMRRKNDGTSRGSSQE